MRTSPSRLIWRVVGLVGLGPESFIVSPSYCPSPLGPPLHRRTLRRDEYRGCTSQGFRWFTLHLYRTCLPVVAGAVVGSSASRREEVRWAPPSVLFEILM